MVEMRDFDPKSMTDAVNALIIFAEDIAKDALTSERILNNFDKREIVLALTGIRPAADALVALIKSSRLNPEPENGYLGILCKLMSDLITIFGAASMYTKDSQKYLSDMNTVLMQIRNSEDAQTRREKLRPVILEVCQGTPLNGSLKFAESIRKEVCEKLGVGTLDRGYSARTIQRNISAILKECSKS